MMRLLTLAMLAVSGAFAHQGEVHVGFRTFHFRTGNCDVQQFTYADDAPLDDYWEIGKGCTKEQLVEMDKAFREAPSHDSFRLAVGSYFSGRMAEVQGPGIGGGRVADGSQYTGASLPPGDGAGNFEDAFGTAYDEGKLGTTRRAGVGMSIGYGDGEREALIQSGAAVLYATATGALPAALSELGDRVGVAFKAIIHGRPPDLVAQAQRDALRSAQLHQIQSYQSALMESVVRFQEVEKRIVIANEVILLITAGTIEEAARDFREAVARMEATAADFTTSRTRLTTFTRLRVADLQLPDAQISALRAGKIPDSEVTNMRRDLRAKLSSPNTASGLSDLHALMQVAESDTNPFRREQLRQIANEVIDDRGLVAAWAASDPRGSELVLGTNTAERAGRILRENLNETLGYKQFAKDPERLRRADMAMGMLQLSDSALTAGNKPYGVRQLERGRVLLDFVTDHPRVRQYAGIGMSQAAKDVFHMSAQATTFEGHQMVQLAERLVTAGSLAGANPNPDLLFHAVTSLREAHRRSREGNLVGFIRAVETGHDVLDYLQGVGLGVRHAVEDTVTGIQQMVTHPAETAEALYHAVANYEETMSVIAQKMEAVIDAYPTMSPMDKGELHGQIATELAGLFAGVGAIKNAGSAVRVTEAIVRAAAELPAKVVDGVRGMRRLSELSPGLLDPFPYSPHNLKLGALLRDAPEGFITKLDDYMEATQLHKSEAVAIVRFREGSSYFVDKTAHDKWVLGGIDTLGHPHGLFVTTNKAADFVQSSAGNSVEAYRKLLGFNAKDLPAGTELYRVNLPFKWAYKPQLPLRMQDGANEFFTGSGFTAGGIPEMTLYLPPKSDILWKGSVGVVR